LNNVRQLLLELLRQEAQDAVGCTEPAMVALAAAEARALAGELPAAIAGQVAAQGGFTHCGEGLIRRTVEETARTLGFMTRQVLNQADLLIVR